MTMAKIVVDVMLKPEILDPQGNAVASALPRLGFSFAKSVRQGKRFEIEVEGEPTAAQLAEVEKAAEVLLSNPVIENFVVQGGDSSQQKISAFKRSIRAEFEREIFAQTPFSLIQQNDLLAEQTGFINGFAVGRSISEGKEWLIHCQGAINLARGLHPNSGTTDFAIMFGTPPRHLDRNMSVFGRIIAGWDNFYRVKRGPKEGSGVFSDTSKASKIVKAYLGSSLAIDKQQTVHIENTSTLEFKQRIEKRRKLDNDFYQYKGNGNMDVCYFPIKTKFASDNTI